MIVSPQLERKPNMIIRINNDHFMVIDEDFRQMLEENKDDYVKISEWVEINGILISDKEYMLLSIEEVESIVREFSWSWISRENQLCQKTLGKMMKFTSFDPNRKKAFDVRPR